MSKIHCHRCGGPLPAGSAKYQVAVRVRSVYDGVICESTEEPELAKILKEVSNCSEEELNRQIHEDDVFILCPVCKEALLDDIYSHLHPEATPEMGRAHLIH
jgi:hypothetical protein